MRKFFVVGVLVVVGFAVFGYYYLKYVKNDNKTPDLAQSQQLEVTPTAQQCLDKLPLDFLIGQVLMVGIYANDMASHAQLFQQQNIGGAVLMTAPFNPLDGSINSFKTAASAHQVPPIIATDEEGGNVQRFAGLGQLPSPADVVNNLSTKDTKTLITEHGVKLKSIGVDMVLGPLADVAAFGNVLGDRVFSTNPITVSLYDMAYVRGWQTAGLLPTLKHFPGMGAASANTDYYGATTPDLGYLQKYDFTPYHWLSKTGSAVMVGNQNVPGWFEGPASLSPIVNQYLRNDIGYKNNLVITDSLIANAISIPLPEAVVAAILAGNDMALYVGPVADLTASTNQITEIKTALQLAVNNNSLPKEQLITSVLRKLRTQHINPCAINFDLAID